jgi:D-arginine dehydrogenase
VRGGGGGGARVTPATRLEIRRIERKWAGLRSFAPDRTLVLGPDPAVPGFVWMAGQAGYGIQTAPAAGAALAALAAGEDLPAELAALGLSAAQLLPDRLRRAG